MQDKILANSDLVHKLATCLSLYLYLYLYFNYN